MENKKNKKSGFDQYRKISWKKHPAPDPEFPSIASMQKDLLQRLGPTTNDASLRVLALCTRAYSDDPSNDVEVSKAFVKPLKE